MKTFVFGLLAGFLLVGWLQAESIQRFEYPSGTEIYDLQSDGSIGIAGSIRQGLDGTAETVSTTSGNSQGVKVPVTLHADSAAVLEGSVLVAYFPSSASGSVEVGLGGATNDLTTVVGIAAEAGSAGDVIDMYVSGFVLARTTGTVVAGNTLVSTTAAAGYLAADATPTTGADVAVALSTGTAAGGLTKVLLYK